MNTIKFIFSNVSMINEHEAYIKQADICCRINILKVGDGHHILSLSTEELFYVSELQPDFLLAKMKLEEILKECRVTLTIETEQLYRLTIYNYNTKKTTEYKLAQITLPMVWDNAIKLEATLNSCTKKINKYEKKLNQVSNDIRETDNQMLIVRNILADKSTHNKIADLEAQFEELKNKINK